jgi:hypothetical protein
MRPLGPSVPKLVVSLADLLGDYPLHEFSCTTVGLEMGDEFMTMANEFWPTARHDRAAPAALHKFAASSDSPDLIANLGFNSSISSKVKQSCHIVTLPAIRIAST